MLWQCPKLHEARIEGDPDIQFLNEDNLPPALMIGLPPALTAEFTDNFWCHGRSGCKEPPHPTAQLQGNLRMHAKAQDLLASRSIHEREMNARQYITAHKATVEYDDIPDVQPCMLPPPLEPNVYSDGALKHPQTQRWSLGGFGVWWPSRSLNEHPLSALESLFSIWETDDCNRLSLWGSVTGHRASSTRTELAAGIITLSAPTPVHQATDSMAYTKKLKRLLAGEDLTTRRPWGIQTDGDLWAIMESIIHKKGAHSINVKWVKGHAKQADMNEGRSCPLDKEGNDNADNLASRGILEFIDGLSQLAAYYAAKQRRYKKLVSRIHAMFLRVLNKEHEYRMEHNKAASIQHKIIHGTDKDYTTLPRTYDGPSLHQGSRLVLDSPKDLAYHQHGCGREQLCMWLFLKNTVWKPCVQGANGSSWIEIMIVYQLMGGHGHIVDMDNPLCIIPSFKQQLANIVRTFKRMSQLYCGPIDQNLFQPARSKEHRLRKYGINIHVPCISAELCLTLDMQKLLHEALANIRINVNAPNKKALHEGTLKVLTGRFSKRGPPPWSNMVTARRTKPLQDYVAKTLENFERLQSKRQAPPTTCFHVQCHVCNHSIDVAQRSLITNGTWTPLHCGHCRANRKASKWLCPCLVPWHTCTIHRPIGLSCIATRPQRLSTLATKVAVKRPLGDSHSSKQKFKRARGKPRHVITTDSCEHFCSSFACNSANSNTLRSTGAQTTSHGTDKVIPTAHNTAGIRGALQTPIIVLRGQPGDIRSSQGHKNVTYNTHIAKEVTASTSE